MKNPGRRGALLALAIALSALPSVALATNTGIAQLSSGITTAITLVQGIAGVGAVILIALAIWEYFAHRKIGQAMIEFVSGVIVAIIAVNAQAIATTLGIGGAFIR